jgi:hypothetical protein
LSHALEEEQGLRVTLEESVSAIEESNNLNISKLIKERDHALSMAKVIKMRRLNLVLVMLDYLKI